MNKDKALDLALEVLQINFKLLEKINPYKGQEDLLSDSLDLTHKAITAIKQARSAPVQSCYCPNCEAMGKELAALKAQPAPVQEPVAFFDWYDNAHWGNEDFKEGCHRSWNAAIKYTTPPAQPAPAPGYCKHCKQYSIEEPLPAAQRQWVGLTNEDIYDCDEANACRSALAYAIEAKLKEKNT